MIHGIIDGSRRRVGLVGANGASVRTQPYKDGHGVKPPYGSHADGDNHGVNIHVKFIGSSTIPSCGWTESVILMISSLNTS